MDTDSATQSNLLLAGIEPSVWRDFERRFRRIEIRPEQVLQRQGATVDRVYFPETALVALVSAMPAGESILVAMVGRDGALGAFEACGSRSSSFHAEGLLAGSALWVASEHYRELFEASEALRTNVHKYVEVLLAEARQFVACNASHPVNARLSRSILEALDRSCEDRMLPTTQDTMAQMLGVQRTTVTAALAELQTAGILRTRRGAVEILDRPALESRACSCWETIRAARAEIYGTNASVCTP